MSDFSVNRLKFGQNIKQADLPPKPTPETVNNLQKPENDGIIAPREIFEVKVQLNELASNPFGKEVLNHAWKNLDSGWTTGSEESQMNRIRKVLK